MPTSFRSVGDERNPSRGISRLWRAVLRLITTYAVKFGVVGVLAYIVDVAVFNLLRLTASTDDPPWNELLWMRALAFVVSTVVAWIGNRLWTFRDRRRTDTWREFTEFSAVAVAGMAIVLVCLFVSHYVLGFTSVLADNIASNVVGFVLATAFRFLMYRYWVYGSRRPGVTLEGSPDSLESSAK